VTNFRSIEQLQWVSMTPRYKDPPRAKFVRYQTGLTYERRLRSEFERHATFGNLKLLHYNPRLDFRDKNGDGVCFPDFFFDIGSAIVIVEIKLTWVNSALPKLRALYIPLVERLLCRAAVPLVVCKRMTPFSPSPSFSVVEALASDSKVLCWPQSGNILW
jgi:hypothetical protein